MEAVLTDIAHQLREEVCDLLILYRDTRGIWDGVTAHFTISECLGNFRHNGRGADVSGINFFSIHETGYQAAKLKLFSLVNSGKIKSLTPSSFFQ